MRFEDRLEMSVARSEAEQHRGVPRIVSISDLAAEAIEAEREAEERERRDKEHREVEAKCVDGVGKHDVLSSIDSLAHGDSSGSGSDSAASSSDAGVEIPLRRANTWARRKSKSLSLSGSRSTSRSKRRGEADDYFPPMLSTSAAGSRLRHEVRAASPNAPPLLDSGSEDGNGHELGWLERTGLMPGHFTPLVPSPPTPASASVSATASGGSCACAKHCACAICVRVAEEERKAKVEEREEQQEQPPSPPPKDAKWLEQTPAASNSGVDQQSGPESKAKAKTEPVEANVDTSPASFSTPTSKAMWAKLREAVKDGSAVKNVLEARAAEEAAAHNGMNPASINTCLVHRQLSWEPAHVDILSDLNSSPINPRDSRELDTAIDSARPEEQIQTEKVSESNQESDLEQQPVFNAAVGESNVNPCMGYRQNSWEPAGKRMI